MSALGSPLPTFRQLGSHRSRFSWAASKTTFIFENGPCHFRSCANPGVLPDMACRSTTTKRAVSCNCAGFTTGTRGGTNLAEVRLQEGEPLENALRRFKRKVQTEDIIKEVKRHSYYLKPGEKRRVKQALARKRAKKKSRRDRDSRSDRD